MTRSNSLPRSAALFVATLALFLCGCAVNPMRAAETPEQKAYAAYGTFVVFEEVAASIVRDPAVPAEVKRALARADAAAKPAADQLLDGAKRVLEVRAQIKAGATTEEQLAIAINNLNVWYAEALPRIQYLVGLVQGEKR